MCPLLQCRGRLRGLHIGGNSSLQGYACSEKFALTEVSTGIPVSLEVSGSNLTSSRRLRILAPTSSCDEAGGASGDLPFLVNCTSGCTQAREDTSLALHTCIFDAAKVAAVRVQSAHKVEVEFDVVPGIRAHDRWIFLMYNFARPANHKVEVDVYMTGIRDSAAAACLAQHVFDAAEAAVKERGGSCPIAFRVLASKRPAESAPRHEKDTYKPYRDGSAGFPQASERSLAFWEDLPEEARKADLVGVIAQFFNFEVVADTTSLCKDMLDVIVPKPGGILIFQSGFNTRVPLHAEDMVWGTLAEKVERAGANIALISNGFSFDKASGKSGVIPPDGETMRKLERLNPTLWSHLRDAGLKETLRFSVDQMAKWLTKVPMTGVDYSNSDLNAGLAAVRSRHGIPEVPDVGDFLQEQYLKARQDDTKVNPVLSACRELHALANTCCGAAASDYLGRAVSNLEKFGKSLECTDGQHFAALLQSEAAVLEPCEWARKEEMLQPSFLASPAKGQVMWAARNINVPQSLAWMESGLWIGDIK
ncbi:unnamed protein product [Symbiodinium microadriaticum]|nr:unnamed protein product [Symbiodinium microadriaticum]